MTLHKGPGWIVLASAVGGLVGLASAFFLISLAWVTALFAAHPMLLAGLPAAGILVAWLYDRYGAEAAGGNNLIIDQIHRPAGRGVPLRMLPLVLFGTLATHLCGGSAGREGTAVQMGGSIAGALGRALRLPPARTRLLLMAGISAGFGSVFGTPLAGTIFAMEVLAVGGLRYDALLPCLAAALAGDETVRLIGVGHAHYAVASVPPLPALIGKVALAGLIFGWTSAAFAEWSHGVAEAARRLVVNPILRAGAGGALIAGATLLVGTRAYNGLSLPLLAQAFGGPAVPAPAFAIKLLLTGLTLGVGFKGGEVTPLFVVGATLGATLGRWLDAPADLMAALGFIAVFAAAANTPLACLLMGAELFGGAILPPLAIAVCVAYVASGHRGIYAAQRIVAAKRSHAAAAEGLSLATLRQRRQRRGPEETGAQEALAPKGNPGHPTPGAPLVHRRMRGGAAGGDKLRAPDEPPGDAVGGDPAQGNKRP